MLKPLSSPTAWYPASENPPQGRPIVRARRKSQSLGPLIKLFEAAEHYPLQSNGGSSSQFSSFRLVWYGTFSLKNRHSRRSSARAACSWYKPPPIQKALDSTVNPSLNLILSTRSETQISQRLSARLSPVVMPCSRSRKPTTRHTCLISQVPSHICQSLAAFQLAAGGYLRAPTNQGAYRRTSR